MKLVKQHPVILSFLLVSFFLAFWLKGYVVIALIPVVTFVWVKVSSSNAFQKQLMLLSPNVVKVVEWIAALCFAVVLWLIGVNYFFWVSAVDTSSMKSGVAQNGSWIVSGLQYGAPRLASHPHYYKRTYGLNSFQHNDVVVFHRPDADTVIVGREDISYYHSQRTGVDLSGVPLKFLSVRERPLLMQRLIGLPGDTLSIEKGNVFINRHAVEEDDHVSQRFVMSEDAPQSVVSIIRDVSLDNHQQNDKESVVLKVNGIHDSLKPYLELDSQPQNYPDVTVYPFNGAMLWNSWYMDHIFLPAKGDLVELNPRNLILYRYAIEHHEGVKLSVSQSGILIDGRPATHYLFKMNYYWVMGDYRAESFDSRYFGLLPENHISGAPVYHFNR